MEYEILGADDDASTDDADGRDGATEGSPGPPRRPLGRGAKLVIAVLAAAGLVAAAVLVGSSGELSGDDAPSPTPSSGPPPTPSLALDPPTSVPAVPADDLGLGQVCEPELTTGDARLKDRLTVSFELANGRDLPIRLTSVTPQLSRPGLLRAYQVQVGGHCSEVGDEGFPRRVASGDRVLVTIRFRLLAGCPNEVELHVLARATYVDGSKPPIPQTVPVSARLPVLDSLPGALFPGC